MLLKVFILIKVSSFSVMSYFNNNFSKIKRKTSSMVKKTLNIKIFAVFIWIFEW